MKSRETSALILQAVIDQKSSLRDQLEKHQAHTDIRTIRALCYGVCRHYFSLNEKLSHLLKKPLSQDKRVLHHLLLIGLYECDVAQTQAYAIVSEHVKATRALKRHWASRLVNGVLRQYLRAPHITLKSSAAIHEHPDWMLQQIQADWPTQWHDIVAANQQPPPLCLRINLAQITRRDYLKRLHEQNMNQEQRSVIPSAVTLTEPIPVTDIPGFQQGLVSVQDTSAQCVIPLLDVHPGMCVLDACAAPGGKLLHLCQAHPSSKITAIDVSEKRLAKIEENLRRSGLEHVQLRRGDARTPTDWNQNQRYDRILVDAPCSASGVIRRQVDVKCHRQPEDIEQLVQTQLDILTALWPLLKPGGKLLYVTCSIFKKENSDQIHTFLAQQPDAIDHPISLPYGQADVHGWQILPGKHRMDGFYYACILKMNEKD